jgi:hypothetical protein
MHAGIAMICSALAADAAIGNVQEKVALPQLMLLLLSSYLR